MHCLIFLLIISVCNAYIQPYKLKLHHPKCLIKNGITMAKFNLDSNAESNITSISDVQLFEYPVVDAADHDSWCLSLISESNDLNFECFNFFKLLNFIDHENNNIIGELSINLNTEGDTISDVTFYPLHINKFRIKLNKVFKLSEPQLHLSLKPIEEENKEAVVEKPKKKVESKQNKKDKREKMEKPRIIEDSYDYDQEMKEFQEIVKPRGLYSENRTFIERYWVYIVPPAVILFVVGNLVAGN